MEEAKTEIKKINKKMKQFVVIGLGRFGRSVATTLADLGKEVLVIDTNAEAIKQMEGLVSGAVVADATGTEVLHSLGVQNFDCVINCIGDDLQSSILTTVICKELGVNYIVAKAKNEQSRKVLEKIGADMVVFPEVYMGRKVANMLTNPSMNEIMNLTNDFKIVEIPVPDNWCEKTIIDLDVRKKHKVSIIFVKRKNDVVYPGPETVLQKGDILIVAGECNKLEELSNKTSEVIDASHTLQDALIAD